ncbi:protease inhibitor I9 family protein [Hyalangium minutum]|uniref:Inhibitor I9 domain-containing protein n=1 Tax=Hyalangium minutum TaxID=394096 RepID=A0A085WXA2_9BACT|nr:protease inhibitor I9 family protein [Hyalangium minutum]KFE72315.1 hypothetical protein DB31_0577 [Hyalangium minutum]
MLRLTRIGLALVSCLALTACGSGLVPGNNPETDARMVLFAASCESPAPLHLAPSDKVPDSYIIVFDESLEGTFDRVSELEQKYGFTADTKWQAALKGFAATLTPELVGALRCEADVDYIDENSYVQAD